jgi:hypothetical protein
MVRAHIRSGGRYPVLRSLAILYMVGAAAVLCYGVYMVFWDLFAAPGTMGERVQLALWYSAVTFFGVVTILAVAELIKLLIDVEHNTRASAEIAAGSAVVTSAGADGNGAAATAATGHVNRIVTLASDEESAEAALLRGH